MHWKIGRRKHCDLSTTDIRWRPSITEPYQPSGLPWLATRRKMDGLQFLCSLINSSNGLSSSEYVAVKYNRLSRNKHDKTMNEFFCRSDVHLYRFFSALLKSGTSFRHGLTADKQWLLRCILRRSCHSSRTTQNSRSTGKIVYRLFYKSCFMVFFFFYMHTARTALPTHVQRSTYVYFRVYFCRT